MAKGGCMATAATGPTLGLDRYVLPVESAIPIDSDGFLDVAGKDIWWVDATEHPQATSTLVESTSSFVLLGAGGTGKTTVLRALKKFEPSAITVNLLTLDKRGMREKIAAALESDETIYLDAIDEAILHEPTVYRVLEEFLIDPRVTIRLRLACRPAAWNPAFAEELKASIPNFRQLRLLPLDRTCASRLAEASGADPKEFINAIVRANLGKLSASPRRLGSVAARWAATGNLPGNHIEAIRYEISELLSESDTGRSQQASLSENRRYRLACRIAAISIFSGTNRFSTTERIAPGLLRVTELPTEPDPDDPGGSSTVADFVEVLSTAAFDPMPDATIAFRHQQYAEYLAAAYLVDRKIKRPQLLALLGIQEDGLLPGAMVGVATWLMGLSLDIADEFIDANAVRLAQAGLELPSHRARTAVVNGLLTQAAKGEIEPTWNVDLSALAYPGLEGNLMERLSARLTRPEELWWISHLAVAGNCRDAAPMLLAYALTSDSWPTWSRRAAITAVGVLGDVSTVVKLRPLLTLGKAEDPDDELLATAIEALYPQHLEISDLLKVLRPRRNIRLVGAYAMLLGSLVERLDATDLTHTLRWASEFKEYTEEHREDPEDSYGRLFYTLIEHGWSHAENDAARKALAHFLCTLVENPNYSISIRSLKHPWKDAPTEARRALAIDVASDISDNWFTLLDLSLIDHDDTAWLIYNLDKLPDASHTSFSNCVPQLAYDPPAEVADLILSLDEDHPAYTATTWMRTPMSIESDTAKQWRRWHRPGRNISPEELEGRHSAERRAALSSSIEEASRSLDSWWKIIYALSVHDGRAGSSLFSPDLTTRPAWKLLTTDEQQLIHDLGLRYIAANTPAPTDWMVRESITVDRVLPDWAAVYLLTTWVRHTPDRLNMLTASLWQTWAPAIIGACNQSDEEQLRNRLIEHAMPFARSSLIEAALKRLETEESGHLSPQDVYEFLCDELAPTLAERLISGKYPGPLGVAVLNLLIFNSSQIATGTCRELIDSPDEHLRDSARRGLARLVPRTAVDILASGEVSAEDLKMTVPSMDITMLDDDRLTWLARALLDHFPFHSDLNLSDTEFEVDPNFGIREARSGSLQQLVSRGLIGKLIELKDSRPSTDEAFIDRLIRNARQRSADLAHIHYAPQSLMQLLRCADARLIRNSDDLLDVIVSELHQLQHEITNNGSFRDLWNYSSDGKSHPKIEDDISDWIRRQLERRITPSTIIDREIQVLRRKQAGIGTRIDLTATAATTAPGREIARIIIEAKLVNNDELMTSLETQLLQRYLKPAGLERGIYLVYWVAPDQRPAGWTSRPVDKSALQRELEDQAASFAGAGIKVRPVLLDISRPVA
jgi:hypothetical protein